MFETIDVEIPHNFTARGYQLPFLKALDSGVKRAVLVAHRRSGKDKTAFNFFIKQACKTVGIYYYLFPTYTQGRKILWDGIDKQGFKFINHIPKEIIQRQNDQEMKIELINGSLIQVVGTDHYDRIVGTNPIGCVFSEYALQDPMAWDLIKPILAENNGWAIFIFTPRGRNHGWDLYRMAEDSPDWYCEMITIDDTKDESGNPVISKAQYEQLIYEGMDEDLAKQEFYCSFEASLQGAYYSKQMSRAREEGRFTVVPYEPTLPVHTFWDIGVGDATAIWFAQVVGMEVRLIDYYETSGEGIQHYLNVLRDKGYVYGDHYAPHDIQVREFTTGISRYDTAKKLGVHFRITPKIGIEEGIQSVRDILHRCWFDKKNCQRGVDALLNYTKEYDDKRKMYKQKPLHDWTSDGADAFRYMAINMRKILTRSRSNLYPTPQEQFDPYEAI